MQVVATDGEAGLVSIAKANVALNTQGALHAPQCARLQWGDAASLERVRSRTGVTEWGEAWVCVCAGA